jgi:hypothetical protein
MKILKFFHEHGYIVVENEKIEMYGDWGAKLTIDLAGNLSRDWTIDYNHYEPSKGVDNPAAWLKPVEDTQIVMKDFSVLKTATDGLNEAISFISNQEVYQFKMGGVERYTRKGWIKIYDMQFVTFV